MHLKIGKNFRKLWKNYFDFTVPHCNREESAFNKETGLILIPVKCFLAEPNGIACLPFSTWGT